MAVNMLDQTIRVFAHLKEVRFFLCRLHFAAAVRTLAVHQLGLGKEGLAGRAVHSLVISFVNIPLVI